jgi:hypothetical protein
MSIKPGATVTKDPNSILVYKWNWSDWLVGAAIISSSTFSVDSNPDSNLTLDSEAIITSDPDTSIADNTWTRVRLTGGTVGQKYLVRNRVVTNESPAQTDDRSIWVQIVGA